MGYEGINSLRIIEFSLSFLLNEMELALFVNSPIGSVLNAGEDGYSLRGIVKDTFINRPVN
jgi:hypothetical protein